jgi:hypothetical protein
MNVSLFRKIARNAIIFMIKAAIVVQKVNKNFSQVHLRNFSRVIVSL